MNKMRKLMREEGKKIDEKEVLVVKMNESFETSTYIKEGSEDQQVNKMRKLMEKEVGGGEIKED